MSSCVWETSKWRVGDWRSPCAEKLSWDDDGLKSFGAGRRTTLRCELVDRARRLVLACLALRGGRLSKLCGGCAGGEGGLTASECSLNHVSSNLASSNDTLLPNFLRCSTLLTVPVYSSCPSSRINVMPLASSTPSNRSTRSTCWRFLFASTVLSPTRNRARKMTPSCSCSMSSSLRIAS